MIKKILFIFLFTLLGLSGYGQTIFTQTFVDRCTGDIKIVTANVVNGRATVAFYNRVKVFTQAEVTNGTLQLWLLETYDWYYKLSPCSVATQQAQQAQQVAQQAQQAAQTAQQAASQASQAASSASSAVANIPSAPVVNVPPPPPPTSGSTPPPPPASSGSSSNNSSTPPAENKSSAPEAKTETKSEAKTETKPEAKKEEKKEETKTESKEEKKEEKKEETKEEKKEDKKEEEKKEDKKEEKKKEDKKKKEEKKANTPPTLVSGDMIAMQNMNGGFDAVLSVGMSKSSIFGDRSYNAGTMIWSNLRQVSLSASTAKIHMTSDYKVMGIESMSVSYSNNFGTHATSVSMSWIEPMSGKKGTFGVGVNSTAIFGELIPMGTYTIGWNALYTNSYKVKPRITYSPAFIVTNTPINAVNQRQSFNGDVMFILSNGFTIQLTKRFIVNFNYTGIKSTNGALPLINSFIIGSKINL